MVVPLRANGLEFGDVIFERSTAFSGRSDSESLPNEIEATKAIKHNERKMTKERHKSALAHYGPCYHVRSGSFCRLGPAERMV